VSGVGGYAYCVRVKRTVGHGHNRHRLSTCDHGQAPSFMCAEGKGHLALGRGSLVSVGAARCLFVIATLLMRVDGEPLSAGSRQHPSAPPLTGSSAPWGTTVLRCRWLTYTPAAPVVARDGVSTGRQRPLGAPGIGPTEQAVSVCSRELWRPRAGPQRCGWAPPE